MATTIPGGVTSNLVGNTSAYTSPQDQAAAYNLQKQMEEDRKRQLDTAFLANANLGQPARDPQAEADAKMKAAFEKFYAPMAQSQWDLQQGVTGGAAYNRGMVGGTPQAGYAPVKKYGMGIAAGQQPYQYRADTNMPGYQQSLDQAYELWKAGQMMGAKDWEVRGGYSSGGSTQPRAGKSTQGAGAYSAGELPLFERR